MKHLPSRVLAMEPTSPSFAAPQDRPRRRLKWSDEAPTSTGFYWYSVEFGSEVVLCEVQCRGGKLRGQLETDERWYTLGDLAGWWMGPIGTHA